MISTPRVEPFADYPRDWRYREVGNSVKAMGTTQSCIKNWTLVTDRTWLQLMYSSHCPNFRVTDIWSMEIVLELTWS